MTKKKDTKSVANLDQISQEDLHLMFRKYIKKKITPELTDEKIKAMLRTLFSNRGITERAVDALQRISPAKKKKGEWRTENFEFDYQFSDQEIRNRSRQLSKACIERNRIDDERKQIAKEFSSKLDSKNAEIKLISEQIDKGHERMLRTCDVHYDFDTNYKIYYYQDKEVGRVRMDKKDYQLQNGL